MTHLFTRSLAILWISIFVLFFYNSYPQKQGIDLIVFSLFASIFHAFLFCLPTWACVGIIQRINKNREFSLWRNLPPHIFALTSIGLLYANYKLYSIYGFYINGFVLNILLTPGGIGALGLNGSFFVTLSTASLALVAIYTALILHAPLENIKSLSPGRRLGFISIVAIFLIQAVIYSFSEHTGNLSILKSSQKIAWYIPITAKSFYRDIGVSGLETNTDSPNPSGYRHRTYQKISSSELKIEHKYNIVWLVAESLRADMLNPRVMPNTYNFGRKNVRFMSHYSGGNGTRMGMFTQFYGLYGNYWFDILDSRAPPLILQTIKRNDYSLKAFTSATFTYPEFDKTIFREFDPSQLQSYTKGNGWSRDRKNVDDLISYIDSTDRPFFTFMFFESSHANYYFPEESVIEPDYIKDFDYLATDIARNIDRIKSRYINATHHLDSQIARIIDHLQSSGKMDDTVIIVTGDHGEEFMEKGRWGHNSTFSEEQTRVPLIIHIPGVPSHNIDEMSSHLDIPATLFAILGVDLHGSKIGFGMNLLAPNYHRDYTVVSDWHGNALITRDTKYIMSSKAVVKGNRTTSVDDLPLLEADIPSNTEILAQFFNDLRQSARL